MQHEILYIQGQLVDIIPNTIDRTIQINDLGSAESRESSYSQTIKLPKTSRNQKVFGFLGVPGNMSRAPYIQLSADYIVDGIQLITNGHAEVKGTSSHYEVVIFDGVIDLAEKLKGRTLSTLNYSDLNHYLSSDTYLNSFSNDSGFIYGLGRFIDDGRYSIKIERQVPSVYTHTLWDKIFKELNINYRGNFFSQNQDFLTEVVTPPQGYEVQDVEPTTTPIGNYDTDMVYHQSTSQDYIFEADKRFGFQTTFSHADITFGTDGMLVFNTTTNIKLSISVNYNSNYGYNNFQAVFNNSPAKTVHLEPLGDTLSINLNLSVNPGDELYFKISGSDTGYGEQTIEGEPSSIDSEYSVDYSASATIAFSEVSGGFLIDFSKMMGDMSQVDFIKDIMQRYGLVLKPVRGSNDYEFIQFEQLLNDRKNAQDWSGKLSSIEGEEYGIKYAKQNKATYNYHEDIEVPTHDGILSIDNENADTEKSLFKSPYEIPKELRAFQGQPMYLHPVWEEKDEDGQTVITVKEAKIKTFRIKKVNATITAYYFNDSNGVNYSGDVPFLSLENMEMQYFINVYYKAYRFAVNNYKEVDAVFNLNLMDVYDLDLFKLKYIKQTGKFYYLNSLKHNAGGKTSKGKLIEINEFSYNLPVETLGTYTINMNYNTTRDVNLLYFTDYANPSYYDPENDSAYKVKFLNGGTANIKMYQAGVEIVAGTEVLVSEWNVTLEDMGNTTAAHQTTFEYQIMDEGSESYGSEVGVFNVSVYEYQNTAPIADAGADETLIIDTTGTYSSIVQLDGSGSTDSTGTITYQWSIVTKPTSSTATITNPTQEVSALSVPQDSNSVGTYTIQLIVTDEFGLSDSDTMTVTINDGGGFEQA